MGIFSPHCYCNGGFRNLDKAISCKISNYRSPIQYEDHASFILELVSVSYQVFKKITDCKMPLHVWFFNWFVNVTTSCYANLFWCFCAHLR